ncbi:hypothetical protein G9A89_016632 [Geosiphon pyriformis]|nr:hypothetical protein G9A89_016632 [Geosiphon pyriformis]
MSPQQYFHALSNDFGNLFNSQKFTDIRIIQQDHHILLSHSSNWIKREKNIIIFPKPNISPKIFEIILRYIYNGEISLDKHEVPTILELLVTADELILENIIDHLEDYLIEHRAKELEKNFAILQKTSFMHDSFKKLQKFCTEIAVENPAIDEINMEETEIWEKIVEWGVAKLDSDIQTKKVLYWTDENFNAFKESIERLLPLIRFFNISSVDFYHKVKPFARILPGTLYEDLLHHYLVPGSHQKSVDAQPLRCSRSNIDTKLLKSQNIKQLDHWIQGKDDNTPFGNQLENNFKLLLRGSRDGFTPADFHRLCDYKGATVSVIKVKGTGQIIGGFNPQSWHSKDDWLEGKGSFIFSLGDDKTENAMLSKFVTGSGPWGGVAYGPTFGDANIGLCGNDFKNSSNCFCQKGGRYEHALLGSENQRVNFSVEEYEVFQIIKR